MYQSQHKKSRFFYGYVIVAASFIILLATFGVHYTFGIFFTPLCSEFGWNRAITSTGYSIVTLVSGIASIISGKVSDKTGPRLPGFICAITIGLGFIAMSQINEIWQFYLVYGSMIGIGLGFAVIPLLTSISRWFIRKRGMMTGILAAGTGCGTILMPLLANWLLSVCHWRQAYLILGCIAFAIIALAAFFLRRSPDEMGQYPDGIPEPPDYFEGIQEQGFSLSSAMRSRHFWIISIIYVATGVCQHTIMVHLAPLSIDEGFTTGLAATLISLIGVGSIIGRITMGTISDHIGVGNAILITLGIITIALFGLPAIHSLWGFYLFSFCFGFSYGAMIALQPLVIIRAFGLGSSGFLMGAITFLYTIGGFIGPALAGYIFDVRQSYTISFLLCGGLLLVGMLVFLTVRKDFKALREYSER